MSIHIDITMLNASFTGVNHTHANPVFNELVLTITC